MSIYLDYAATTPIDPAIQKAIAPFLHTEFGNPSAPYHQGRVARAAVEESRVRVAAALGCSSHNILFMGSGTESTNTAIFGVAAANPARRHIITQATEHKAVLEPIRALEKRGWKVTILPVDSHGLVRPSDLTAALTDDTLLVSIMYANNEIGTVQPIAELARIAHAHGALFHTDACQAGNVLSLAVDSLGVDLLTLNGGKIYAPKGGAVLYVGDRVSLAPLIYGGGQERGLRAGTENVPAIVGLGFAVKMAQEQYLAEATRLAQLRQQLIAGITKDIPDFIINGSTNAVLPSTLSVSFKDVDAEKLVSLLDDDGIAVGMGSACDATSVEPSHVLQAIKRDPTYLRGTIRITMGRFTTSAEIEKLLSTLPPLVRRLRQP